MTENFALLRTTLVLAAPIGAILSLVFRYVIKSKFPDLPFKWRYPLFHGAALVALTFAFARHGRWAEAVAAWIVAVVLGLAKYGSMAFDQLVLIVSEWREQRERERLADERELEYRRGQANQR